MGVVGVDIGKYKCHATRMDMEGKVTQRLEFENSREGAQELLELVEEEDKVAMDATGHYWMNLHSFLGERNIKAGLVNPLKAKRFRQIFKVSTKTDKIDSHVIANLVRVDSSMMTLPNFSEVKYLTRMRTEIVVERSKTKQRIEGVLDKLFPEYRELFTDLFCLTSMALLKTYTTPQQMAALTEEELGTFLREKSKGKFGEAKAKQILDEARNTFGLKDEALGVELMLLLRRLRSQRKEINLLETEIEKLLDPEILLSIPGVGKVTAASVMAEIGDINTFESPVKLRGFAGLYPRKYQSGEYEAPGHMAKTGNKYLRTALYMAALCGVRRNPVLKKHYEKKLSEGKEKKVALMHCASKLLNIIYWMMKRNEPFRADA